MLGVSRTFALKLLLLGVIPLSGLGGCGLFVPQKNALTPDIVNPETGVSSGGEYEDMIVRHVSCEIAKAIWEVSESPGLYVPWLRSHQWGTAVTLTITAQEQNGM